MAYHVFVTATRTDLDLAAEVALHLQGGGATVRQAAAPVGAANVVDLGLRRADEVIVILSPQSLHDPALMFELGAAYSLHKRVTPVLMGVEEADLPQLVRQLPWVHATDLPSYVEDLEERVRRHRSRGAGC
jgi:TIR domain